MATTDASPLVAEPTEQTPGLGDIVTRGTHSNIEYRIWLINGDIAIATSQTTGIPHRVPLASLHFVRHVPGGLFGPHDAALAGGASETEANGNDHPPRQRA